MARFPLSVVVKVLLSIREGLGGGLAAGDGRGT